MKITGRSALTIFMVLFTLSSLSLAQGTEAAIDFFWCGAEGSPVRIDGIYGNGTNVGVTAEVTNRSSSQVLLKVTAGMVFSPYEQGIQRMIAVGNEQFYIPVGAEGMKIELDALCLIFYLDLERPQFGCALELSSPAVVLVGPFIQVGAHGGLGFRSSLLRPIPSG